MEFDQKIVGLEDQLIESRKKLEHLTMMVQNLTDAKKGTNGKDTLKRIEAKLDIIAQSDPTQYIDMFLENLKADLDDKQGYIGTKISSMEDLTQQIAELIKNSNNQEENNKLVCSLDLIKKEINSLTRELTKIQSEIDRRNEQIANIDNEESFNQIKSVTGSVEESVNAAIFAISNLDAKVKSISDNLTSLPTVDNIDVIRDDVAVACEKINGLLEIFQAVSTTSDIEDVKQELDATNSRISEFQGHIDESLVNLKENIDRLLNTDTSQEASEELTQISERVDNILINSRQISESISSLDSKEALDQVKFATESLGLNVNNIMLAISSLDGKLSAVSDNQIPVSLKEDIEQVRLTTSALDGGINSVRFTLTEIESRIHDILEGSTSKNELTHLIERINSLNDNDYQIQSATDVLNVNINSIRPVLSDLEAKINDISGKIDPVSNLDGINQSINEIRATLIGLLESANNQEIKNELSQLIERINCLNENNQQIISAITNITSKEITDQIKSNTETLDLNINAVLSALSILDKKVKTISESIDTLSANEGISSISGDLSGISEKIGGLLEVLQTSSTASDIEDVKDKLIDAVEKISGGLEHIEGKVNITNIKFIELQDNLNSSVEQLKENVERIVIQGDSSTSSALTPKIDELKTLINSLFIKDETKPVIENLTAVQSRLYSLEELTKNGFESKTNRVIDELCLIQDKLNISVAGLIRPLKDELIQFNERILDLKEYFTFQANNGNEEYKNELATIADRFNDIWTNAGLTLEKLAGQISTTEKSIQKFENTVDKFFETAEDTNLIITHILKKTTDVGNFLNELNATFNKIASNSESILKSSGSLEIKMENLTGTLGNKLETLTGSISTELKNTQNKLSNVLETDLGFLRNDIIEFKDKQERIIEDSIANQESIQNGLSNLHFSLTDSTDLLSKRVNELGTSFDKIHNSVSGTLNTQEIIKGALVQVAGWIDNADRLINEINNNVKESRKNNEAKKILIELQGLKENIVNSYTKLGEISIKVEGNLSDTKKDIRLLLGSIKKQQESDFENINTNISGVSQEIFNISQNLIGFENKVKQDLKILSKIVNDNVNSESKVVFPIEQIDSSLNQLRKGVAIELRRMDDKFTRLEVNLSTIEDKISRLESKQDSGNDNLEIKQLLEFIAGHVTAAGEGGKGTGLLLKKMSILEKKVSDMDTGMKKVIDFLDSE